jgi:Phytanoyl-CoA dioxygenase (PhyH)
MVDQTSKGSAEPSAEVSASKVDNHAVRMTTATTVTTGSTTLDENKREKPKNDETDGKTTPKPMTGEPTQEADVIDPDEQVNSHVGSSPSNGEAKKKQSKNGKNSRRSMTGAALVAASPKRRTPIKIEPIADDSESSSTHDYFGTFRGFLRGEKCVEKVRTRLASPKKNQDETPPKAAPRSLQQPLKEQKKNGSSAGPDGSSAGAPSIANTELDSSPPPRPATTTPTTAVVVLTIFRSILIDFPMVILFATFLVSWIVKGVHKEYFEPLFYRAQRVDTELLEEFTYYERQCTGLDLTTRDTKHMLVDYQNNTTSIRDAVDIMMTHGLSIIPQVLQPDTVRNLREYIVYRNENIPDEEEYPMSQGHKRISYGIEATEHPAVIAALREVANHPLVRPLLAELLGDDDPASSEITAITNYPGARRQVWHQDTKQDGNAIKFARTYSHSYSLFLPLQDITERMGATDVCPGTHYCTNDLAALCSKTRVALNEVTDQKILPAGAGALLNQHLWHRGGAHTDPDAPDRIVFIVSFLARPNFGVDPRQLSRGTYFHQKWNMWGHTWYDLLDPAKRMRFPFSILRCLSIWKPSDSNWGYDLITSGFMRFANGQLEAEDFHNRFLPKLDQIHFPSFLRGRQVAGSQLKQWAVFIRTTIEKVHKFFAIVVLVSYLLYLLVGTGYNIHAGNPPKRWVPRALIRLLLVNGLLAVIGARVWVNIRNSAWGKHVSSGRALMRPVPPKESYSFAEQSLVSKGPTTMPTRWDVLIGTRLSADFLGSYRRWLDFHPGNVDFRYAVQDLAASFQYFASLEPRVQSRIVLWIMNEIRKSEGRVLLQDFTTGDWRVLSEAETFEEVAKALSLATSPLLDGLASKIDVMIDDRRFGPARGTVMGSLTHLLLFDIRRALLYRLPPKLSTRQKATNPWPPLPHSSMKLRTSTIPRPLPYSERIQAQSLFAAENPADIQVGTLVWAHLDEAGWFPGSVLGVSPMKDWFFFAGDDSELDESVYFTNLQKFKPPTEGGRIMGCFQPELEDCYPGTITRVHPGGSISIYFDDGEAEPLMPPGSNYQPPFRYGGPFPV